MLGLVPENAIRPFAVGRKNWLFNYHPQGAAASAGLYSLIESAKANELEPYRYMRFLFEQLPLVDENPDAVRELLPNHIDKKLLTDPTYL